MKVQISFEEQDGLAEAKQSVMTPKDVERCPPLPSVGDEVEIEEDDIRGVVTSRRFSFKYEKAAWVLEVLIRVERR